MSKIKKKKSFPRLLSKVLDHEDCPTWLEMKIWNALNDNSDFPPNDPEYLALMLKNATVAFDLEYRGDETVN